MMTVTVLGSGTCIPTPNRGNSGYLLQVDAGSILLDGGSGALRQLARFGHDYRNITHICYTHLHPDHTLDFVPLLFALKNDESVNTVHPLKVFAPVGFREYWQQLEPIYHHWISSDLIELTIQELTPGNTISLDFVEISTGLVNHTENSIAYKFMDKSGQTVVYSGDTGYSESFAQFAAEADLLIIESAFPENRNFEKHSSPSKAAKMAAIANAKTTILTHFYPETENEDILGIARQYYHNKLLLAEDGLTYTLEQNSNV